jgi:N-acetylglutamate synthase-like GNAT family acetyltransferase
MQSEDATGSEPPLTVRQADRSDLPAIARLLEHWADRGRLLAIAHEELDARRTGARRVAVLTFETRFFERLGFEHHDERDGARLHAKPNTLGNARMSLALDSRESSPSQCEIALSEIHPSTTQPGPIDGVSS